MERSKFIVSVGALGAASLLPLPVLANKKKNFVFRACFADVWEDQKLRQIGYYDGGAYPSAHHLPYITHSNELVFPSKLNLYHTSGKWFKVDAGTIVPLTTTGELWLRVYDWYGPRQNMFTTHRDDRQIEILWNSDDAVFIGDIIYYA